MSEQEPRQRTPDEILEDEFGATLVDKIRGLLERREVDSFNLALQKIEEFLQKAGIEIEPWQRQQLHDFLRRHGREYGLSDEE